MSRKSLGPPPDWIAREEPEDAAPDPLRSIFKEARTARAGTSEVPTEEFPALVRTAAERALQYRDDQVADEIKRRLRAESQMPGLFAAVYVAPSFTSDVADTREARLVILGPGYPHMPHSLDSRARRAVASLLQQRGAGPRRYRNTLVFLAPDQTRLLGLQQVVREYLAWRGIAEEGQMQNLDPAQCAAARARRNASDEAVQQGIPETFQWLLLPVQPDPGGPVEWRECRVEEPGTLAIRAGEWLQNERLLLTELTGPTLRRELDRMNLWPGDHVEIARLAEWFAVNLTLPRLRDTRVLLDAIQDGLERTTWQPDTFAFASGYDETRLRYRGLRAAESLTLAPDTRGLLVKPDVAYEHMEQERRAVRETSAVPAYDSRRSGREQALHDPAASQKPEPPTARRFHGSVALDAVGFARDAGKVRMDVIQQLLALVGAGVKITLDIEANAPDGIPASVIKSVADNCHSLRFARCEFE